MKKFLATAVALVVAMTAAAEGYQVNSLSARQGGMAHTGVAQKLNAESMYFNPAGLGFMSRTVDLQGSFNAVLATAKAYSDGECYETDNDASTPMMFNAAFSIYDCLKAGVSFYTPYGSGINWGQSWPGAVLSQQVALKAFTVQPTVSFRILTGLSVGAGLTCSWGTVDLYKGLVNPSSVDMLINLQKMAGALPADTPLFNGTMPASVNLQGTSSVSVGYNIGVMYDINKQWTLGAQFRSKSTLKVKAGDASVSYANALAQGLLEENLKLIDKANFTAQMPLPWVLTVGAAYRPNDKWLFAFDAQLTGWSAYKSLDVEFLDPNVKQFNQYLIKDYKDSPAFRLGAQWSVTHRFDLRAGLILDLSPVNHKYYNPETPGMTKIEPSVGLTFRPVPNLAIDLSMLYVAGLGVDGVEGPYADLIAKKINPMLPPERHLPEMPAFKADYRLHAFVPSIGISYGFNL